MLWQDIPPSDPVDQDEEETWDTVGVAAERSVSPPPTTGKIVPRFGTTRSWRRQLADVGGREKAKSFGGHGDRAAGGSPGGRRGNRRSLNCGYCQYSGCPDRDCCPVDHVSFVELPSSRVDCQSCMID
jgi:hypothetical protein